MSKSTLNKDGQLRKPGSGRTKGSVSFSYVKLNKLNQVLTDNINVPVSRVWLRNLGIEKIENS